MRTMKRHVNANQLELVRKAKEPLPLRIGARVRLNSGGPVCLVVGFGSGDRIVVAMPSGEAIFSRACLSDA